MHGRMKIKKKEHREGSILDIIFSPVFGAIDCKPRCSRLVDYFGIQFGDQRTGSTECDSVGSKIHEGEQSANKPPVLITNKVMELETVSFEPCKLDSRGVTIMHTTSRSGSHCIDVSDLVNNRSHISLQNDTKITKCKSVSNYKSSENPELSRTRVDEVRFQNRYDNIAGSTKLSPTIAGTVLCEETDCQGTYTTVVPSELSAPDTPIKDKKIHNHTSLQKQLFKELPLEQIEQTAFCASFKQKENIGEEDHATGDLCLRDSKQTTRKADEHSAVFCEVYVDTDFCMSETSRNEQLSEMAKKVFSPDSAYGTEYSDITPIDDVSDLHYKIKEGKINSMKTSKIQNSESRDLSKKKDTPSVGKNHVFQERRGSDEDFHYKLAIDKKDSTKVRKDLTLNEKCGIDKTEGNIRDSKEFKHRNTKEADVDNINEIRLLQNAKSSLINESKYSRTHETKVHKRTKSSSKGGIDQDAVQTSPCPLSQTSTPLEITNLPEQETNKCLSERNFDPGNDLKIPDKRTEEIKSHDHSNFTQSLKPSVDRTDSVSATCTYFKQTAITKRQNNNTSNYKLRSKGANDVICDMWYARKYKLRELKIVLARIDECTDFNTKKETKEKYGIVTQSKANIESPLDLHIKRSDRNATGREFTRKRKRTYVFDDSEDETDDRKKNADILNNVQNEGNQQEAFNSEKKMYRRIKTVSDSEIESGAGTIDYGVSCNKETVGGSKDVQSNIEICSVGIIKTSLVEKKARRKVLEWLDSNLEINETKMNDKIKNSNVQQFKIPKKKKLNDKVVEGNSGQNSDKASPATNQANYSSFSKSNTVKPEKENNNVNKESEVVSGEKQPSSSFDKPTGTSMDVVVGMKLDEVSKEDLLGHSVESPEQNEYYGENRERAIPLTVDTSNGNCRQMQSPIIKDRQRTNYETDSGDKRVVNDVFLQHQVDRATFSENECFQTKLAQKDEKNTSSVEKTVGKTSKERDNSRKGGTEAFKPLNEASKENLHIQPLDSQDQSVFCDDIREKVMSVKTGASKGSCRQNLNTSGIGTNKSETDYVAKGLENDNSLIHQASRSTSSKQASLERKLSQQDKESTSVDKTITMISEESENKCSPRKMLTSHETSIKSIKPQLYKCEICEKSFFTRLEGLKQHQANVHSSQAEVVPPKNNTTKTKPLLPLLAKCKLCSKSFLIESFGRHLRVAHPDFKGEETGLYKVDNSEGNGNFLRKDMSDKEMHKNDQPLICSTSEICPKDTNAYKENKIIRLENDTSNTKPLLPLLEKCKLCSKSVLTESFARHLRVAHPYFKGEETGLYLVDNSEGNGNFLRKVGMLDKEMQKNEHRSVCSTSSICPKDTNAYKENKTPTGNSAKSVSEQQSLASTAGKRKEFPQDMNKTREQQKKIKATQKEKGIRNLRCRVCNQTFYAKHFLWEHLKQMNHYMYKSK